MDGFDEATKEFEGFLETLLSDLPKNHKVFITTRPYFLKQLSKVNGMEEKQQCKLSIKSFNKDQVKNVTEKYGINPEEFDECYNKLKDDKKQFLENPLNLNLVLKLWSQVNNILLLENLSTHKLYEHIFEKQISDLVIRLKGRTTLDEEELELSVRNWFHKSLCKITVESLLRVPYDLCLNKWQVYDLSKYALDCHLIANYSLSTFLDSEESSGSMKYFFRHRIQKETLVLKEGCNSVLEDLSKFVSFMINQVDIERKDSGDIHYNYRGRRLKDFFFLFECCDSFFISNVFKAILRAKYFGIFVSDLVEIKNKNQEVFKAIKNFFIDSQQKMTIRGVKTLKEFKEMAHLLLPEIRKLECYIHLNTIDDDFETWNNVMNDHKNDVYFCFNGNTYLNNVESNLELKEAVKAFLNICLHFNNTSLCCAYFQTIKLKRGDPKTLLEHLVVDIKNHFHAVSVGINFEYYEGPDLILDSDFLKHFLSMVKVNYFRFDISSLQNFQMQILCEANVEILYLHLCNLDNSKFLEFFDKWDWRKQTELHVVYLKAKRDQLKLLYQYIHNEIASKTSLKICEPLSVQDMPQYDRKRFKQILLDKETQVVDYKTYTALKNIAEFVHFIY